MSEASPRWLDRAALARHIGVRVDYLPRLSKGGKLPTPSYHLGPKSPRWDREAVDAMFAGTVASPVQEHDLAVQEAVNAIINGRKGRPAHAR